MGYYQKLRTHDSYAYQVISAKVKNDANGEPIPHIIIKRPKVPVQVCHQLGPSREPARTILIEAIS